MVATMNENWKQIGTEPYPWERGPKGAIPARKWLRIKPEYLAAIPSKIAKQDVELPKELDLAINSLLVALARFDTTQQHKDYTFPSMLLRSESAASSQIESLTSSIKNIALAQVSTKAPKNAQLIAGNVAAMHTALQLPDELSKKNILKIHKELMAPSGVDFAGKFREQQVWISGTEYSPHDALFVPPHQSKVESCLDDLIAYSKETDVNPIVKSAIVHAQFETIHPFIDGNGRTGRTLIHKVLRQEDILRAVTLPISAGLLHNINGYLEALQSYQAGNPVPIVEQLVEALELAVSIAQRISEQVEEVLDGWKVNIKGSSKASIWKLLPLLVGQPVVNAKFVAENLGISVRAASYVLENADKYTILTKIGRSGRDNYYQAKDLVEIFSQISDIQKVRRLFQKQ
ncbi:MAG: Fic family protein [Micrococcaceae bacterium]